MGVGAKGEVVVRCLPQRTGFYFLGFFTSVLTANFGENPSSERESARRRT